MIKVAVAALACLCLARGSPAEQFPLRAHPFSHSKELNTILAGIEERLRLLENISAIQMKQGRRLDVIQDKIDRMETTLTLRLERAQLAAERLEHRLHMLQTNVQASIKESTDKIELSQLKVTETAINLTKNIEGHRLLLEKANGAYADTWRRGLVLENMMRDSLYLVNATRREFSDGLRSLARRQRDSKCSSGDAEANIIRKLNENSFRIDKKMQEALDVQKRFADSCQRVQLDDPSHVADVLDKLIDSLINKTAATFKELQNIQVTMRTHDTKVMKLLSTTRFNQNDGTCRRLESVFKNMTTRTPSFQESELQQLTEKFVELTDRADAALQRLEKKFTDDQPHTSDITSAANKLMLKLSGIRNDEDSEDLEWDADSAYFDGEDLEEENESLLRGKRHGHQPAGQSQTPRTRHLYNHPYDRGPKKKPSQTKVPSLI